MHIKMILSLVLIFTFGSFVSCFPISKDFAENSNFINDTNQIIPKIHKSSHKKSHSHAHAPPVIKFLKKFDFDPSLLAHNYSAISDFCNISHWNWQLNNSGLTLSTPLIAENSSVSGCIRTTKIPQSSETPVGQSESTASIPAATSILTSTDLQSYETLVGNESGDNVSSTITSDFGTITIAPNLGENKIIAELKRNGTRSDSGRNVEDDSDNSGALTRILLLLILMLQNVFLFVMVLFYRSMKKTSKKCERK